MILLITPFLFFQAVFSKNSVVSRHVYARLIPLDNLRASETPTSINTSESMPECTTFCAWDEACVAVMHHGDQCSIYRSSLSPSSVSLPGARCFIKQGALPHPDPCPVSQGYTSVLSPRLCYKLHMTILSWTDSQARCESEGGRLIILSTDEKHAYILTQVSPYLAPYIGLKSDGGSKVWTDGSTYIPGKTVIFSGNCAYIYKLLIGGYVCYWERQSLCEIPV
ncbi:C-type lectin domain family 7 member A-like [Haliotis cracherodii]|uniref:C-type lectin domain family 7 member A-like n=1 Tax=Haliotis cracherodii TaxID=6455 RepID=UPI0039E7A21D